MRSPRLVPYWSVHETLGVDARMAPVKMRRRRMIGYLPVNQTGAIALLPAHQPPLRACLDRAHVQ